MCFLIVYRQFLITQIYPFLQLSSVLNVVCQMNISFTMRDMLLLINNMNQSMDAMVRSGLFSGRHDGKGYMASLRAFVAAAQASPASINSTSAPPASKRARAEDSDSMATHLFPKFSKMLNDVTQEMTQFLRDHFHMQGHKSVGKTVSLVRRFQECCYRISS